MDNSRPRVSITERNKLIVEHLYLVRIIASSFNAPVEIDELISLGNVGLVLAARGFDPTRGLAFSTYAYPRIKGVIQNGLQEIENMSIYFRRIVNKVSWYREIFGQDLPLEQISSWANVPLRTLQKAVKQSDFEVVPISSRDPSGEEQELPLSGPKDFEVETVVLQDIIKSVVRDSVMELPEKDRAIILSRYFDGETLRVIADRYGCSQEYISQRIHAILPKLRVKLQRNGFFNTNVD